MTSIENHVAYFGGLAATHELLGLGNTQKALGQAVWDSRLLRIRKGWYALPGLSDQLHQAARVGGRLACVSAAIEMKLWVPSGRGLLHVAVPPNACQLRSRDSSRHRLITRGRGRVVVHWTDQRPAVSRLIVDPIEMLREVCCCQSSEFAFVVCESALQSKTISLHQFKVMLEKLSEAKQRDLRDATALSGSGSESIFIYRMKPLRLPIRQQVELGPDRVDFLIGERLVVEIDSIAHHDPTEDCRRDARLSLLGYRVLRFMYSQVVDDWETVRDSVLAAMSRGDHLAF